MAQHICKQCASKPNSKIKPIEMDVPWIQSFFQMTKTSNKIPKRFLGGSTNFSKDVRSTKKTWGICGTVQDIMQTKSTAVPVDSHEKTIITSYQFHNVSQSSCIALLITPRKGHLNGPQWAPKYCRGKSAEMVERSSLVRTRDQLTGFLLSILRAWR